MRLSEGTWVWPIHSYIRLARSAGLFKSYRGARPARGACCLDHGLAGDTWLTFTISALQYPCPRASLTAYQGRGGGWLQASRSMYHGDLTKSGPC